MTRWIWQNRKVRPATLIVAVVSCLVLSGCGSSGTKTAATTETPATTAASGSAPTTASTAASGGSGAGVTVANLAKGDFALPSLPKVTHPKDASIWIIPCSLEAAGCSYLAGAQKTILVNDLHWKVTTFDGQLSPAIYSTGIKQAIVAKANAIMLIGIDCASVKPALTSAKQAHIPVVDIAGFDCTAPSQGGTASLLTTSDLGGSPEAGASEYGKSEADDVAAETGGKGQIVLATEPDFEEVVTQVQAFQKELPLVCPGCKIVAQAPALGADLASGAAAGKLSSVLIQHPTANTVVALQDAQLSYVANALRTASKHYTVISLGGTAPDVQLVRTGVVTALDASDTVWQAWQSDDTIVRLVSGTSPVVVPEEVTLIDKQHNLPKAGAGFVAPVDYVASYETSWGVSGG
jgi:ribose transport system substrate-binding protein